MMWQRFSCIEFNLLLCGGSYSGFRRNGIQPQCYKTRQFVILNGLIQDNANVVSQDCEN